MAVALVGEGGNRGTTRNSCTELSGADLDLQAWDRERRGAAHQRQGCKGRHQAQGKFGLSHHLFLRLAAGMGASVIARSISFQLSRRYARARRVIPSESAASFRLTLVPRHSIQRVLTSIERSRATSGKLTGIRQLLSQSTGNFTFTEAAQR